MNVETMRLADLHASPLLQTRGGLCSDTVREYTAAAKGGAGFPPLLAYRVTDRTPVRLWLVAGFHRRKALLAAGVGEWAVEVREGTFADAWLAGWLSNVAHGLRYTNDDKRKAACTALLLYRDKSARAVADLLGLSHDFVSKVRKEMVAAGQLEPATRVTSKDGTTHPHHTNKQSSGHGGLLSSDDSISSVDKTDKGVSTPLSSTEQRPSEDAESLSSDDKDSSRTQNDTSSEPSGSEADESVAPPDTDPEPAHAPEAPGPSESAPGAAPEEAGPATVGVAYGGPADCKRALDRLVQGVKKLRAGISCVIGSTYGDDIKGVFAAHAATTLHRTGNTVDMGSYGKVITVGPPEWSCTALDELAGQLSAASLLMGRVDARPPGRGEFVPPWESVAHLGDGEEGDVPL